jgi:hypothetical protein
VLNPWKSVFESFSFLLASALKYQDPETETRTPETLINAQFQDRAASNRRIRSVWSAAENGQTGSGGSWSNPV